MPTECKPVCPHCGFDDCESQAGRQTPFHNALDSGSAPASQPNEKTAIDAATELLSNAISPLICGLNCLNSQSQFAAWKLADRLRATVDTTMTNRNRAAVQTFQRYGKVTATYGEIRNRSDLIVFWDCDLDSHAACLASLIKDGKTERKIVFVGDKTSTKAKNADVVFSIPTTNDRGQFISFICSLRTKLAGVTCTQTRTRSAPPLASEVDRLVNLLIDCDYGCLFFKQHASESEFDLETESLMLLVRELNSKTRFVGSKLRDDLNGLGAETVLTLASGFPQAINLSRSSAQHAGLNYSAATMLNRGAVDVVVLFGDAKTHDISTDVLNQLAKVKVIQIGRFADDFADVFIPADTLERAGKVDGLVFRGDGAMLQGCDESQNSVLVDLVERLA